MALASFSCIMLTPLTLIGTLIIVTFCEQHLAKLQSIEHNQYLTTCTILALIPDITRQHYSTQNLDALLMVPTRGWAKKQLHSNTSD